MTNTNEGKDAKAGKVPVTPTREEVSPAARLSEMVAQVTEIARRMFKSSGASVLLLDKENHDLIFKVATGKVGKQLRGKKVSTQRGVAGWVTRHGEPLILNDVSKDARFDKVVDKGTGFVTKSLMCAPLLEREKAIGVIEVVNKLDGSGFSDNDLEILSLIARLTVLPICFLEEEQTRKKLVTLAVTSKLVDVRIKAIDVLAGYGRAGVPYILQIVNKSVTKHVRTHGLTKIEAITKKPDK